MKRSHALLLSLKEKVSQTRAHISSQVQADPSNWRCWTAVAAVRAPTNLFFSLNRYCTPIPWHTLDFCSSMLTPSILVSTSQSLRVTTSASMHMPLCAQSWAHGVSPGPLRGRNALCARALWHLQVRVDLTSLFECCYSDTTVSNVDPRSCPPLNMYPIPTQSRWIPPRQEKRRASDIAKLLKRGQQHLKHGVQGPLKNRILDAIEANKVVLGEHRDDDIRDKSTSFAIM